MCCQLLCRQMAPAVHGTSAGQQQKENMMESECSMSVRSNSGRQRFCTAVTELRERTVGYCGP